MSSPDLEHAAAEPRDAVLPDAGPPAVGLPAVNQDEYVPLRRCDLRRGTVLKTPVLDERGVLLLAAGQVISDTFHAKLVDRGLLSVQVHAGEVAELLAGIPQGEATQAPRARIGVVAPAANATSEALDQIAMSGRGLGLPRQGVPFGEEQIDRSGAPYDPARRDACVARLSEAVGAAGVIQRDIASGRGVDLPGLNSIAEGALDDLAADRDLFAAIGLSPHSAGYPTRHGVHASMLAAAVGATLGLDRPTLNELTIGVLVHDAGMLRLDPALYDTPGPLGKAAFLEITKHPVLVFEALKSARDIPPRAAFIAYQMHERCDGSGYPRRRTAPQLHALAKIAAVVDAFAALTSPRPYRPALAPHHAMRHVLKEAAAGAFDLEAVRALLRTVSLFPLGSRVKLDDGRRGRVLRITDDYSRPLIELDPPGGVAGRGGASGELLDLSAHPQRRVTGVSADAPPLIDEAGAEGTRAPLAAAA
ncbi:HD-GYP domain-containing protein [Alienimonas californiensis]|uniref:Cyclic di-GMP phosphodiesterase response regulator RpfG n=1 Tax=Alienimonas californiensis TaxID=2527989 RepID=A0A517P6B7_9PLAN|nr:HD domain-containing phosphohydrolase [Alienimonas californiensis]QDT14930.1 Cyclic di-GMP phosphodiesterase response regulator RpfG [Alienimonas californiensis]